MVEIPCFCMVMRRLCYESSAVRLMYSFILLMNFFESFTIVSAVFLSIRALAV